MDIELYKRRKKELYFTFDELAKRSGVSRRALTQIFSNPESSNPTTATIQKIERALGIGWTSDEMTQGVSPEFLEKLAEETANAAQRAVSARSVRNIAEEWLEIRRPRICEGTYRNYTSYFDRFISPIIGDKDITKVTSKDVNAVVQQVEDSNHI